MGNKKHKGPGLKSMDEKESSDPLGYKREGQLLIFRAGHWLLAEASWRMTKVQGQRSLLPGECSYGGGGGEAMRGSLKLQLGI